MGDRTTRGGRNSADSRTDRPEETSEGAESEQDQQQRARDIVLGLLTTRPRSSAELREALRKKKVDEHVADTVLERLGDVGLVDDAAFTETWIRSRHTYQGLGRKALRFELRRKGVDPEVVDQALESVDRDAERERARQLVRRRLRGKPDKSNTVDDRARVRRLVGMLARKGYSEGLAYQVVREEVAAAGADVEFLDDLEDH